MKERPAALLILDLGSPPNPDHPVLALLKETGLEHRVVDAGWASFLYAAWEDAAARRRGDPLPDLAMWRRLPGVRKAFVQEEPFILAGRSWQQTDSTVEARGHCVGGARLQLIAGPCSVESPDQMRQVAQAAAVAGAGWLRGGAYKPRSSPYHFQGLGEPGLDMLRQAADEAGLAVITEVLDLRDLPAVAAQSDVIQVGSRNAQNFPLLKELGGCGLPVLLKRGFGCTLQELLLAAEYVMSHGNPRVILCERGIRSFEPATRFTFDINAIPWLKQRTHLPVVADPSHGTGDAALVPAVARAAVAAGADGLMLEVHPVPAKSASDAGQALGLAEFAELAVSLLAVRRALGRES